MQPVFNRDILSDLVDTATSVLLDLEAVACGDETILNDTYVQSPDLGAVAIRAEDDLDSEILKAVVSESPELFKEIMARLTFVSSPNAASRLTRVFMQALQDAADSSLQAVVDTGLVNFAYEDEISGRLCLHEAVLSGRLFAMQLCLTAGSNLSKVDVYGRTALHYACMQSARSEECTSLLLQNSAPVNILDHNMSAPIHYAIINGNLETVTRLLKYGADINPKSETDYIPLSMACARGHLEIARLLLQDGAKILYNAEGLLPIHVVARAGHRGFCKLLLEHKNDMEARDKFGGWTPVFFSASEGHVDVLRELIECGASVDVRDDDHHSPTYYSAWEGHTAALQVLLNAGGAFGNTESQKKYPISQGLDKFPNSDTDHMDLEDDGIPSLLLPPP